MTKLKSPPTAASRIDPPHNIVKDATPRIGLSSVLRSVSRTIAPLWPLADYVAVNPFLGLADRDWLAARRFLRSFAAVETLMPFSYYRNQFEQQQFTIEDLEAAIDELLRDGVPGAGAMDAGAIASALLSDEGLAAADEASGAARHCRTIDSGRRSICGNRLVAVRRGRNRQVLRRPMMTRGMRRGVVPGDR